MTTSCVQATRYSAHSRLSLGREYFLVNEAEIKWERHCGSAAWSLSSLLAELSNLLVPFSNHTMDFKGLELVNLLSNFSN